MTLRSPGSHQPPTKVPGTQPTALSALMAPRTCNILLPKAGAVENVAKIGYS